MRPSFSGEHANFFDKKVLSGRSARVVVTMGMPAVIYRWYFRAHSVKSLERNLLGIVGVAPVHETLIGLQPTELSAYVIYGVPVYAPCTGVVEVAIDGLPDMPVPQMDREHMAGNHVLLRCAGADVLLGHLQPGSIKVKAGDQVAVGQLVGAVGNSGNTGEPHLHIHAQQAGTALEPISGSPLPIRLNGRFLVRNDRVIGSVKSQKDWTS